MTTCVPFHSSQLLIYESTIEILTCSFGISSFSFPFNKSQVSCSKSSTITKKGAKVSFNLGGIKQSFTINSVKTKAVKKITFMISQKGKASTLKYNGLYSIKMVKNYSKQVTETIDKIVTEYHDVQNKFTYLDQVWNILEETGPKKYQIGNLANIFGSVRR